jgi:ribonuclease BN (tRNA processing enzyme)
LPLRVEANLSKTFTVRVTFLGTADGYTSPGRDHSGILIQTRESTMLLDCGADVARYLLHKKFEPDVPDLIWLSHMHSDHVGKFVSLIQSLWLRRRRAPLHVCGPAQVLKNMEAWLEQSILFPRLIGFPVQWHAVKPGRKFRKNPFSFSAFATRHLTNLSSIFKPKYPQTCYNCYGVALTYRKERYVYSADLHHPRELRPALRQPTKALFCELTHFTEEDLFEELTQHNLKSLWITHYPDRLVGKEAEIRAIAKRVKFKGKVYLMSDKRTVEI